MLRRFGDGPACLKTFLRYTDERSDLEDFEYNQLFKFDAFMSSRSGDIGPSNLKNILKNMTASERTEVASGV